ncbi:hypothetical protein NDU88_001168, partial [Pleurodeles waltl]
PGKADSSIGGLVCALIFKKRLVTLEVVRESERGENVVFTNRRSGEVQACGSL